MSVSPEGCSLAWFGLNLRLASPPGLKDDHVFPTGSDDGEHVKNYRIAPPKRLDDCLACAGFRQ